MKIIGYRSTTTAHRWGRPVGDANGAIGSGVTEVPVLLVLTDGGITGIGLGAHADVDRVFPALDGEDPRAVTALYDRMLSYVFKAGHAGATFGAIGVLDMALWDLKAKLAGEPLWRTLGARDRFVPGYASALEFAVDDDALASVYEPWAERGFLSAKIKGGLDPERDISRLRTVGEVLTRNASSPALMLDVNESWGPHQAVRFLSRIEDQIDLTWVEEPVRRWDVAGNARRRPVSARRRGHRGESHRPRAVPAVARCRCGGGGPGRQRVGDHPLPPRGHARPRSRSPDQPRGLPRQRPRPCRDRRTEPPRVRAAGPDLPDRHHGRPDHRGRWCSARGRAGPRHRDRRRGDPARSTSLVSWADPAGPHVRPRDAGLRLAAPWNGTRRAPSSELS